MHCGPDPDIKVLAFLWQSLERRVMRKEVTETMKIHDFILGTFLLLIMAGNIHPASFDCGKAATEVEKIICAEPDLSQFDESLSMIYQKTLGTVRNPAELKRKQVTWMREVRNLCTDRACLEKVYRNRLAARRIIGGHCS